MITNLTYDFSIDRKNNTIDIKREFVAPPQVVWDAFTKSEILDQWWAPKPWKTRTKSMDFREGGRWLYSMNGPEGEEHWAVANFRNIQPLNSFSVIDTFSDSEGNVKTDMPGSAWEITFTNQGNSTLVELRISYDDAKNLDETLKMGFREGITMAFENLDNLLGRKAGSRQ